MVWDDNHKFTIDPDPGDGSTNAEAMLSLMEHYRVCHLHEMKNQVREARGRWREEVAGWPQEREKMLEEIEQGLWRLTTWDRPARLKLMDAMSERQQQKAKKETNGSCPQH